MTNVFNYLRPSYRVFSSYWWREVFGFPALLCRVLKWAYQRVTRGWADCDVWSMDSHLSDIIPPMVRYLKKANHGHPCDLDEQSWHEILEAIAVGFEAVRKMDDVPEEFITRCSVSLAGEIETYPYDTKYDWPRIRGYQSDQEQVFRNGFYLFEKYFRNLWD